jgi:MinD superfamily P-loop ATPase
MLKPEEIVVLSGKGGTGKTSVTAAIVSVFSNSVIADCDVDAADLHLVMKPENPECENFSSGAKAIIDAQKCISCGRCLDVCRFNAVKIINGVYNINPFSCEGCGFCRIVCNANAIELKDNLKNKICRGNTRFGEMVYGILGIAEENSGKLVAKVREIAKNIAIEKKLSKIIIDGPPGIGCPVISSITGAKKVLVVAEPTKSGFHDMKRLIELSDSFSIEKYAIINRYTINEDISKDIEQFLNRENIPVLGKIPYDKRFFEAAVQEKSFVEMFPNDYISIMFKDIAAKL